MINPVTRKAHDTIELQGANKRNDFKDLHSHRDAALLKLTEAQPPVVG
jgi:hypothetical protein